MKIYYDGFIYRDQKIGGINRYFENIICRLDEKDIPMMLQVQNNDMHYPTHPQMKVCAVNKYHFWPRRVSAWVNRFNVDCFLSRAHPDIAHPTFYSLLTRQKMRDLKCPVVITVYDMISELYPALADPRGREIAMKRQAISSATAIICISENTKVDLVRFYPEVEHKITVILLGVDASVTKLLSAEKITDRPYFLYVGSRFQYKNFAVLLQAFAKLVSKQPDVMLVVAGSLFNQAELNLIDELKLIGNIKNCGCVDDHQLASLYSYTTAFVYPSLYEGFGVSLLEAMVYGAPVIAANASCFPEVVGDAGLLFNPTSVDELTDAMFLLLDSQSDRASLISKGYRRSKLFSWDETAKKTRDLYCSLVGQ